MAIKISGTTIINDSRVVEDADKIGIGIATPQYDLHIHSDTAPTGVAVSHTSTQSTDTNKALTVFNNSATSTFAVSYKGRVDAAEYYGVFKGTIDTGVNLAAGSLEISEDEGESGTNYIWFGDNSTQGQQDQLRIDKDGLVYKDAAFGVGTNGPYYRLDVRFSNNNTALSGGTSGNWGGNGLRIQNNDTTAGSMSLIHFRTGNNADWHIGTKFVGTGDSDIVFLQEGVNEKLRIKNNGRVNIGQATDPDHVLCVAGTDATPDLTTGHGVGIQLQNKSTTDNTYSQIEWRTSSGGRYARIAGIQKDANGNGGELAFLTENDAGTIAERLRITSGGDIRQQWNDGNFLGSYYDSTYYMGFTFGATARTLYIDNRSNDTRADIVFRTKEGGAPEERLRITSDGQIGVNNTSPDAWHTDYRSLQIYDAGVLYGSQDDSFVGLGANHFLNTSGDFKYSNTDFASRFYQVNGGFHFESVASGTAGNTFSFTERLRITSAGIVGINTNNPGA